MSGGIKHYYLTYFKMEGRGQSDLVEAARVKFLNDCGLSVARHVWDNLVYFQEQETQTQMVKDTAEATNDLTEQLERLREELLGEITKVKRENTRLRNKVNALEADESGDEETAEDDADTEDDDAADPDSDDDEETDESEDETEDETDSE